MQDCGIGGAHFERQTQSDCDDTEQRRHAKTRIQASRSLNIVDFVARHRKSKNVHFFQMDTLYLSLHISR